MTLSQKIADSSKTWTMVSLLASWWANGRLDNPVVSSDTPDTSKKTLLKFTYRGA